MCGRISRSRGPQQHDRPQTAGEEDLRQLRWHGLSRAERPTEASEFTGQFRPLKVCFRPGKLNISDRAA